jgi:hypothetical protein
MKEAERVITNRGARYAVGHDADGYAVWDGQAAGWHEVGRWPLDDSGWANAYGHYGSLEGGLHGQKIPPHQTTHIPLRDRTPPPSPPGPPKQAGTPGQFQAPYSASPYKTEYSLIGLGGALVALSTVLPWLHVDLFGSLNLFRLATAVHITPVLPWAMAAMGIGIAVQAYRAATITQLAWTAFGTLVAVLILGDAQLIYGMIQVNSGADFESVAYGFYVALAGLVLLAVGVFRVNRMTSPSPVARPTNPPPPSRNAGWYQDPFGTGRRYWDGSAWTEHTAV